MAELKVEGRKPSEERKLTRWGEFLGHPGEFFPGPFSMMRRIMDEMERPFAFLGSPWSRGSTDLWAPAIEVTERGGNLVISADLPGLSKDEIKVNITDEGLVLEGERKREHEEKREGYYRSERSYGRFYRVVPLPEGATIEKAHAKFNNGVLEVTIPTTEVRSKRREIPIDTAEEPKRMKAG